VKKKPLIRIFPPFPSFCIWKEEEEEEGGGGEEETSY